MVQQGGDGGADGAGHVTSMEELPVLPGKSVSPVTYSHPPAFTGHEAFWSVMLVIPYEQVVM